MATTHPTAVRNSVASHVLDPLNGGPGKLVFRTAGTADAPGVAVASLSLSPTAFGAPANGTAAANSISPDTNAAGHANPVATATLDTSAGAVRVHCAVAANGADINLNGGLAIGAGDQVSCSSLTYSAMP